LARDRIREPACRAVATPSARRTKPEGARRYSAWLNGQEGARKKPERARDSEARRGPATPNCDAPAGGKRAYGEWAIVSVQWGTNFLFERYLSAGGRGLLRDRALAGQFALSSSSPPLSASTRPH